MRFLADESCDFVAVTALRNAHHDIRFPAWARRSLGQSILDLVAELGDRLVRAFVVVEPGRARVSRPPSRKGP